MNAGWLSKNRRVGGHGQKDPERTFYGSIRFAVTLAGLFGILPVSRAFSTTAKGLCFRWLSLKVLYTTVIMILLGGYLCLSMKHAATIYIKGTDAKVITAVMSGTIFHASGFFSVIFFLNLSRKFPDLMSRWDKTTSRLSKYTIPRNGYQPKVEVYPSTTRINTLTGLLLFGAVLDRMLHELRFTRRELCDQYPSFAHCYLTLAADNVTASWPCTQCAAVLVIAVNCYTTFAWTFLDLILVILSVGLHHNFTILNKFLKYWRPHKVIRSSEGWRSIREDHLECSRLVQAINRDCGPAVLYSYGSNLASLCAQLFLGIRPRSMNFLETLFSTVSFIQLLLRLTAVTWAASNIHQEVQRFRDQIVENQVTLSGCHFFFVTKASVLGIISTIVTYEVIFLEF